MTRIEGRQFIPAMLFIGFLYPVTVSAVSLNYSFVIFPALIWLYCRRLEPLPVEILLALCVFSAIFLMGSIAGILGTTEYPDRMLSSFVLFITLFALCNVRINEDLVASFRWAIVIISVFFCMKAILTFLLAGGSALGYDQKDLVGSQRYGFIYLIAFHVVFFIRTDTARGLVIKAGLLFTLSLGLFLTFSRASIFGLVGSLLLLWIVTVLKGQFGFKRLFQTLVGLILVGVVISFLAKDFYFLYDYFFNRIVERLILDDSSVVLQSDSSEGTRIEIWSAVWRHTLDSPFWGAGYLGTWTLREIVAGSAHSQYMDVLFRVGLIGFATWLALLAGVFRFLKRMHRDLFWGYVAVLIYGLFHETFKESHGTFVLAFFIAMHAQSLRDRQASPGRSNAAVAR